MRDTIRLGRVAGVRVGAHWSLLAVVVLLGLGLAHNQLPFDVPGLATGDYDLAGAATAVGLILAVLAHEAGHAFVARRAGLGVDGITLSWMGGVTRIEGDTRSPGWEIAVAGVGPAVSAVAGLLLLAVRAVGDLGAPSRGDTALVLASLGWLGGINLLLAVFNLIPAAPLDGGRILHGLMWRFSGDRWRATRLTSRIGVGFGVVVVVAGLAVLTRSGDTFNALVLAVLGYWLIGAARTEGQTGLVRRALAGATVADLMRPVGAAPGWLTLAHFLDTCHAAEPGWVWLLEGPDGNYAGVLTGEAALAVAPHERAWLRSLDVAVPAARGDARRGCPHLPEPHRGPCGGARGGRRSHGRGRAPGRRRTPRRVRPPGGPRRPSPRRPDGLVAPRAVSCPVPASRPPHGGEGFRLRSSTREKRAVVSGSTLKSRNTNTNAEPQLSIAA
jgi:Zn-dependent protease